jgi:hypothetical protein
MTTLFVKSLVAQRILSSEQFLLTVTRQAEKTIISYRETSPDFGSSFHLVLSTGSYPMSAKRSLDHQQKIISNSFGVNVHERKTVMSCCTIIF